MTEAVPDDLVAAIAGWAVDAASDQAARERADVRLLAQQAAEEATVVGLLLDVAERGEPVVARTTAGRQHRGRVVCVGGDFVVIREPPQPPSLLALAAVTSVRPQAVGWRDPIPSGARRSPLVVSLRAVLTGLAADRPRVQVACVGDEQPLAGELRAVGTDLVTLALDGPQHRVAHVNLASIADVVLVDWTP